MARLLQGVEPDSDKWLEERRLRVTASAAPCVVHLGYHSLIAEYNRRFREQPPAANHFQGALLQQGKDAEPYILHLARTLFGGGTVISDVGFFVHPHWTWLGATPDGFVANYDGGWTMRTLEMKRASSPLTDNAPRRNHVLQVVIQCICTNLSEGYLLYVNPVVGGLASIWLFVVSLRRPSVRRYVAEELMPRCEQFAFDLRQRRIPSRCPPGGKRDAETLFDEAFMDDGGVRLVAFQPAAAYEGP